MDAGTGTVATFMIFAFELFIFPALTLALVIPFATRLIVEFAFEFAFAFAFAFAFVFVFVAALRFKPCIFNCSASLLCA